METGGVGHHGGLVMIPACAWACRAAGSLLGEDSQRVGGRLRENQKSPDLSEWKLPC